MHVIFFWTFFFQTYTYLTLIWLNRIEGRLMSERVAGKQDRYERDNESPSASGPD